MIRVRVAAVRNTNTAAEDNHEEICLKKQLDFISGLHIIIVDIDKTQKRRVSSGNITERDAFGWKRPFGNTAEDQL